MSALPVLTIHERDITSAVCQRCAKCCDIIIKLPSTDSRYRKFLRGIGFQLSPPAEEGKDDCCDKVHEVDLYMGPCRHLRQEQVDGETLYACGIYGDPRRPELCDQFNCVSWAKTHNCYTPKNTLLQAAQDARTRFIAQTGPAHPEEL